MLLPLIFIVLANFALILKRAKRRKW